MTRPVYSAALGCMAGLDGPLTEADYDGYSEAEWGEIIAYWHGELAPGERAALERRIVTEPAFAEAATSVRDLWQHPLVADDFDVEDGLRRLRAETETTAGASAPNVQDVRPAHGIAPLPFRQYHRFRPRLAHIGALAAAALVGIVGTRIVQRHRFPVYYYQGGTNGSVAVLPDSTRVTLAPGSYLGTAGGFPHGTRMVYLYGSGHFTVAHNTRVPFVVRTLGVGTRVLGTTFSVHADTLLNWQVRVAEGRVTLMVRNDGHWRALRTLTAGEAVHIPIATAWMAQAGHDMAATGMSARAAAPIEAALRRAVIRLGAAAAREEAEKHAM